MMYTDPASARQLKADLAAFYASALNRASDKEKGRRNLHPPALLAPVIAVITQLIGWQIHRGMFAATIDLELELEPVAFVERRHAGALDRAKYERTHRAGRHRAG